MHRESRDAFRNIAAATVTFWNKRALRHGAFEEYYPYEQGYPPVAFATLGVTKLCHEGVVPLSDIRPGLAIAARQLLTRFEAQAANQQIAGTAALSVIRTLDPSLVEETRFQQILGGILGLQHAEGWFPEYDGPDLGYLAVSIDCLWDIHDHTDDPRVLPAIKKAADFISWFAMSPLGAAGMHNSRNTDYLTPYGLVRLAIEQNNATAAATVDKLFLRPVASDFHPFDAVDDRYWCHYIGHSVFRALGLLEKNSLPLITTEQSDIDGRNNSNLPSNHCPLIPSFPGSGHAMLSSPSGATALVSTRKGAIVTARWPDGALASDFGWLVDTGKQHFVTHWWSMEWETGISPEEASCEGYLVAHREHTSEPWKHILLRIASFLLGRRLIGLLKRLVIFKKPQTGLRFTRKVCWEGDTLVIRDSIQGVPPSATVTLAPRTSKRHVASADSYHPQDLDLLHACDRTEKIDRTSEIYRCESRYERQQAADRP